MKREIKVNYCKSEQAYTIRYFLHYKEVTMQFVVRCPTEQWHYYCAIDLGYHADKPMDSTYEPVDCNVRPCGKCYYDGTALGAQELWDEFKCSGDEEVIWKCLERWAVGKGFDTEDNSEKGKDDALV